MQSNKTSMRHLSSAANSSVPDSSVPGSNAPVTYESRQREELVSDSHAFFRQVVSAIDSARTSVDIETYIMVPDQVGNTVFAALERAAARGVEVRLLVDGFGSAAWLSKTDFRNLPESFQLGVYHPVPVMKYYFENLINAERTIRALMKLNSRNHKKLIIVDNEEAFTGSFNLWNESLVWKEIFLRTDISIEEFRSSFEFSWSRARLLPGWRRSGRRLHISVPEAGRGNILFNFSYRTRHRYLKLLNRKILGASHIVWLMTPYFVPPVPLLKVLRRSAARGVDVRLVLPKTPDHYFMKIMARYYYPQLLESGIKIYEYTPEMLHAKALLVDDWTLVGSSNINHRSFFSDLEIMVTLGTHRAREQVRREFDAACAKSVCLTEVASRPFPLWKRFLYRILLATRRWI